MDLSNVTLLRTNIIESSRYGTTIAAKYGNQVKLANFPHSSNIDSNSIAELRYLERLLVDENVLGEHRGGKNLKIEVSSQKITHFVSGGHPEKGLLPYGEFLLARFRGAEIKVSKQQNIDITDAPVTHLKIQQPSERQAIHTPALGDVVLSNHVIERFEQRAGITATERTLKRLKKILFKDTFQKIELTKEKLAKKRAKYGDVITEYWIEPFTKWKFIVICNNGRRLLTTAYQ